MKRKLLKLLVHEAIMKLDTFLMDKLSQFSYKENLDVSDLQEHKRVLNQIERQIIIAVNV